jgi:2-dehydro-3-deoxyphosphogluconate aldolase/(4S)-4-hydroxy-2-oxoglutarate aldolase
MARFRRMEVLRSILETGLVPVFYHPDVDLAFEAVRACARGGSRLFEFTNRGDMAHRVFEALELRVAKELPSLILGVGSIGDPYTAALYIAAGAAFVVGPVLDRETARISNRRKIAYIPGCGSATEIAAAEELGSEIVKVFPGDSAGGPDFVKAIRGPSPWTSLMPTGGVDATQASIREWIRAGVAAVGIGSGLLSKDVVAARDWSSVETRVRQVLEWIQESRKEFGISV